LHTVNSSVLLYFSNESLIYNFIFKFM